MIRKVSFRNFKAYRSLDMELEPLTVLVGPNASGKTTLLEGLHLVSAASRKMMASGWAYWPSSPRVQSYGVNAPVDISVHGEWAEGTGYIRAVGSEQLIHPPSGGEAILPFKISGHWNGKKFFLGDWKEREHHSAHPGVYGDLEWSVLERFRAELGSTAILQFEAERLSEASYSEEPIPQISSHGSGLASALAYLKLSQDEIFEEIERALRGIVPTVHRIRIERAQTLTASQEAGEHKVWGNQLILDMQGAKSVSANAAGEGTLMALGLLTVLLAPPHPRLVLLDDIELKLHPAAQAKLVEVLRAIQKRDPKLQIIATSHSPFILNYLDPKEVRMTFLAENGFARCEKLTAHPEFEKWKDLMSPGEFWSTVGESWLEKVGEASTDE
jgi:predicted ATPase